MNYFDIINKYHYPLEPRDVDALDKEFQSAEDKIACIKKHLHYCDCTRTMENGMRIIQTIGQDYKWEITRTATLIEMLVDHDAIKTAMQLLIDRHTDNIEFEKTTPPIIYDNKKKKTPKVRKAKEGTIPGFEKPSKAILNLKAKLVGVPKLTIKIKN